MIEKMLHQVTGKRLTSAGGTFHIFDGCVSVDPIALWFGFDGARQYRFAGASDGWHLVIDYIQPRDVDMQESGTIQFRDMSTHPLILLAIGQEVCRAWLVGSPGPEDIIGVRFDFASCMIRILNWGDEMRVVSEFPPDADANEIVECPIQ